MMLKNSASYRTIGIEAFSCDYERKSKDAYNTHMDFRVFTSMGGLLAITASLVGCSTTRPTHLQLESQSTREPEIVTVTDLDTIQMGPFLAIEATGRRNARQMDPKRSRLASRPFPRETMLAGRAEGSLAGHTEFPLSRYLDPHSIGATRPRFPWPTPRERKLDAFFAEFRPAIPEWPSSIRVGETTEAKAQITAFEFDGVPFATGDCSRAVRAIGYETVIADGETYPDSLRMEADTELVFGWLATIRIHEVVWFVRGLGWVRREDRYQGRALWLFRFQSESGYELANSASGSGEEASLDQVDVAPSDAWNPIQNGSQLAAGPRIRKGLISRVAICFERAGRNIRMSGLAMEWDVGEAEPNTPQ